MNQGVLLGLVLLGYGVAGLLVARQMGRRDPSWGTLLGAWVAWPVFLPLLGTSPSGGPCRSEIDAVFRRFRSALMEPGMPEFPWTAELDHLEGALCTVDTRVALVDRLLVDSPETSAVRTARDRSVAAIKEVLDEVVQWRLHLGLAALEGDPDALRVRLQELLNRVRALDEVASIHG